jgi:hypothetical protein
MQYPPPPRYILQELKGWIYRLDVRTGKSWMKVAGEKKWTHIEEPWSDSPTPEATDPLDES